MNNQAKLFEVYLHRNTVNGKGYVGITCRGVRQRLYCHESEARNGSQRPFARAIRKYGIESFETTVLQSGLTEVEAREAEQVHIKRLRTFGEGGYNATLGGEGTLGVKMTTRRKQEISEHFKAMPRTEQHRKRCSEALTGRIVSEETIEKMAAARRGVKQSAAHAARSREALAIAKNAWTGMKHSGEAKRKMREAKARVILINWPDGSTTIERTTYRDLAEQHGISHSAIAEAVQRGRVISKKCGLQGCFLSNFSDKILAGAVAAATARQSVLPL